MEVDQHHRDQTHPNPPPSNHRKIELQSPLDLTYLQDNLAKVALEKLNFVLPDQPSKSKPATVISLGGSKDTPEAAEPGVDDPLKQQVRDLVSEFLQRTWQSAQHNLTLNGLDASNISVPHTATLSNPDPTSTSTQAKTSDTQEREGVHFTYSPFDSRLQHKLASLHGELEKLTAEVSKLRREAPKKAASTYASALEKHILEDDEAHLHQEKRELEAAEGKKADGLDLDSVREGWAADLKEKYTGGVRELASLAGVSGSSAGDDASMGMAQPSLTETMGKAIRARDVVHDLE